LSAVVPTNEAQPGTAPSAKQLDPIEKSAATCQSARPGAHQVVSLAKIL
jgi:hypothetical protein